jgi:hypothetical protein
VDAVKLPRLLKELRKHPENDDLPTTVLVRDREGKWRRARAVVFGASGDVGLYVAIDAEREGDQ